MKAPLFDNHGKNTGTVDLEKSHFGVEPNMGLIHRFLLLQQANGRIAIAHAKHRGEIAGSTKKMFKQKGTSSARMGDRRSPMRRGGGVVFGPRNTQNWTISMNAQERRLSLLSLLSIKATEKNVKVISAFGADATKTKGMTATLSAMEAKKPLIAVTREEKDSVLGAWNIPEVKVVNVEYLNPHSLLKYKDLVFTEASLKHLYSHFSK